MSAPVTVLVIDDNTDDRSIVKRHLNRDPHGRFMVDEAAPSHALEQANHCEPDVFVIDQHMGADTGDAMIATLRSHGYDRSAFVLLTGSDEPDLLRRSAADDHLQKDDLTPVHLRRVVLNAKVKADLRVQVAERLVFEERLIAIVGHDLRGPLSAATMGAKVLETQELSPYGEKSLQIIQNGLREAKEIVDRLMDLSRVRSGGFPVHRQQVCTDALFESLESRSRSIHPDIAFEVIAPKPATTGLLDASALQQMVGNLVANAARYGQVGTPIRITGVTTGGHLEIAVANQGEPIPPEARARLFQPFEQLGSRDLRGLGLGLYIVRSIAQAHGGSIELTSDPTRTTFTASLPLA